MKRLRNFQGIEVVTHDGQPTRFGEGVRITLPDGSTRVAAANESHRTLDAATCYAVNLWAVERWRAAGSRGVI